jgi:hypothetical protein
MSFTRADYPPLSTIGYVSTLTSVTFNPSSITGLNLWLDATDPAGTGIQPANGTTLTTWKDKSVSNFPLTTAGSAYNTTAVNGLPGISLSTNFIGYDPGSSQNNWQEIFVVGVWTGGSTFNDYNGLVTGSIDSGSDGIILIGNAGGTGWYGSGNGYQTPFLNGTQTGVALPAISTPFQIRTFTGSAVSIRGIRFGIDRIHTGRKWVGFISEVLSYNTTLTATQRQQVEGYLAWKWGTQASLPGGHLHASSGPSFSVSTLTSTLNINLAGYIQSGANYVLKPQIPLTITPYYTAFNPITLSTLALWIDGADPLGTGITPTQGTLLSSLKDKSGNNRAISTFSTTVGFPTYKTAANGSLGAIELVAGNGIFLSSIALTPSMSLYLVYSPINPGSGMAIEQGLNALSTTGFLLTSVSTTSTVFTFGGGGGSAVATGGTVTPSGAYKIHTFTTTGNTNFILTSPASITAQVLVVGGGGSGGSAYVGGGGGAGGAVYNATFTITAGTYTVTVGTGGVRTTAGVGYVGPSGVNSSFSSITGTGGGGGGSYMNVAATNGGCGGGGPFNNGQFGTGSQGGNGAPYGTDGLGGYNCGGGGGGMGGTAPTPSGVRPSGGAGATYTVAGTAYTLAGGGGAGSDGQGGLGQAGGGLGGNGGGGGQTPSSGGDATPNTGSGGGGGGGNNGSLYGGAGGSGIVIIAYLA